VGDLTIRFEAAAVNPPRAPRARRPRLGRSKTQCEASRGPEDRYDPAPSALGVALALAGASPALAAAPTPDVDPEVALILDGGFTDPAVLVARQAAAKK
jgi:hypothetical protein